MAINWTLTLDRMSRIPGIDVEKVREHGAKLLPILKRHHDMYQEMTGDDGEASTQDQDDQEIVDLISSDLDIDADEDATGGGEDSHYFGARARPEVQAFHDRLQGGKKFSSKKWPKKAAAGVSKRKASGPSRRASGASSAAASTSRSFAGGSCGGGGSSSGFKRDGKIVKKSNGGIGLMPL
ncbi:hypothetical protein PT974_08980 [Cladobotryum mycophilum]|uniref:HRDC domain-containing protein n=1 Tax=Cladobotryum mycophilum TaxID=491253 RepID=A0ABR0SGB4_9HYPO